MKKHYRHENDCANCGSELQGKFCHVCGQENLELRENFGHMMNHAISDYFHFDHQFFHTLKPLFFQPGKLTNEYMAGKRVQYLHPIKMYIFISLVYFVLLFNTDHEVVRVHHNENKAETKKELAKKNAELEKVYKDPNVPDYTKNIIKMANKKTDSAINKSLKKTKKSDDDDEDVDIMSERNGRLPGTTHDSTYTQYLAAQQKLTPDERDGFLERMYNKKAFVYKEKYGTRGKEVFYEELKHNVPKMMFLMLPLCALILRIAFWKNKKYYVEHLIFTFHLHCFLFMFLAIIMLLQMLGKSVAPASWGIDGILSFIATIGIAWYIYRALRVFYHRSRWRTIFKIFGAGFMYFFVFVFCLCVVFIMTAITM